MDNHTFRPLFDQHRPSWEDASVFYDPDEPFADLDRNIRLTKLIAGGTAAILLSAAVVLLVLAASL